MKTNFLILFVLIISTSTFGQSTDTSFISINQEEGVFERPRFIDQYDYLFGTKQPTRLLVKLNVVPVLLPLGEHALEDDYIYSSNILGDFAATPRAELGVEWKINPAISLYAGGLLAMRGSDYWKGRYFGGGGRVESRWYYNMPRRIRATKSANNVSGNYIGIDYQTFVQRDGLQNRPEIFQWYRFQSLSLRYGLQRRLGRYGFIDASIGAGYQHASSSPRSIYDGYDDKPISDQDFFLETRVSAGLAFGTPRTSKSNIPFCDVLRCLQEDNHLWKLGLIKALRLNQSGVICNPKSSYEQKIGSSSFSIETEGELFINLLRRYDDDLHLQNYGVGFNVQPRWYFLQKHRILKGKSGNNLAGLFMGWMGGYRWSKSSGARYYGNDFYMAPHVGIQQRLFRNGFVNYKFGLLYSGSQDEIHYRHPFLSELQIGFAF